MTDANDPIDWTGKKNVNLALQGGGSHGAFTWGVLDYLLEDTRPNIEVITRTSAGTVSRCVLWCLGSMAGTVSNLFPPFRNSTPPDP